MIPAGRTPRRRYAGTALALRLLAELVGAAAPTEFESYWLDRYSPEEIAELLKHV